MCLPHLGLLFVHRREHRSVCKFVCTNVCQNICFRVTINILWPCMSVLVCMCHPSFEDHKYGRGSRQACCLFSVAVDNASEVVTFCHPSIQSSLHPSIFQFLFASRKDTMSFKADNSLIRPNQRGVWHPTDPQKSLFLFFYSSACQFLCLTLFLWASFCIAAMVSSNTQMCRPANTSKNTRL